jgi:hypothetical protein
MGRHIPKNGTPEDVDGQWMATAKYTISFLFFIIISYSILQAISDTPVWWSARTVDSKVRYASILGPANQKKKTQQEEAVQSANTT